MSRILNPFVNVCAWLVNFQPVLTPSPSGELDDMDMYFASLASEDSDYDADTELSDQDNQPLFLD